MSDQYNSPKFVMQAKTSATVDVVDARLATYKTRVNSSLEAKRADRFYDRLETELWIQSPALIPLNPPKRKGMFS